MSVTAASKFVVYYHSLSGVSDILGGRGVWGVSPQFPPALFKNSGRTLIEPADGQR